jgi:hypothetical protein
MMKRSVVLAYGAFCYSVFFAVFSYAILFIGNLGVRPSLDTVVEAPFGRALLIDVALLTAFALQHSIMARKAAPDDALQHHHRRSQAKDPGDGPNPEVSPPAHRRIARRAG